MSQVNTGDNDNETPDSPMNLTPQTPNSPPPSFHSRASSIISPDRNQAVDSTLADAFDSDGDDSEDESDDRQRLVRGNSFPVNNSAAHPTDFSSHDPARPVATRRPAPQAGGHVGEQAGGQVGGQAGASRVYGGGIQSDGVFSNLAAKPEVTTAEKEEQPPVC